MAQRTFRDRHGRVWDVWDVHPTMGERREAPQPPDIALERRKHSEPRAALPHELRNGWLAFESRKERRRLAPIPVHWETMPDEELAALLERAEMTGAPRRLIE